MAYLVTGGTGFIGSRVVRDLVKEGQQAVIYDLFPNDRLLTQLISDKEKARVKIVQGDVTDLPLLMHTVKENGIDIMFHLAAILTEAAAKNPPLAIKVNCEGTLNAFETARLAGLKKVVWASSMSVFGRAEKGAGEYIPNDAPHYPWGVYGACKSLNERVAAHYVEQYGIDITAVRYNLVYGAGQARGISGAIVQELILNPALGKPGRVPYGDVARGWLYVDDAARATVMASKVTKPKTLAFSTMGDLRSAKEIASYVKRLIPEADITLLPGVFGIHGKFDTRAIEDEIGYRMHWTAEDGVKDTINMVRRQNGLPPVK